VLGGYYPSTHALVNGVGSLDTFEALWQLTELLGQVKPPVATKDDIAKAGLEVVSPETLKMYRDEGKVAESTVDRCLICLDDYSPDDEARLLKCKHAFHLACVDKWLEEGKNNCPACRSQGVPVAQGVPVTP